MPSGGHVPITSPAFRDICRGSPRDHAFPALLAALLAAVVLSGCSSYRTFNSLHWAKEAYKEGKRAQQDAEQRRRTGGISATAAEERQTQILGQEQFEDAARKCLFFLSQSSEGRRTDDVLLLMGQSFFELRRFVQARNSLQTLIEPSARASCGMMRSTTWCGSSSRRATSAGPSWGSSA